MSKTIAVRLSSMTNSFAAEQADSDRVQALAARRQANAENKAYAALVARRERAKAEANRIDHLEGWHVGMNCEDLGCTHGANSDLPVFASESAREYLLERNIGAVIALMRMRSSMAAAEGARAYGGVAA